MLTGSVADPTAAAVQLVAHEVAVQARTLAFNDLFLWLGAAYLAVAPLLVLLRKPQSGNIASH